jgi:hypothetical protein
MKIRIMFLISILLIAASSRGWGADVKITELPAVTSVAGSDVVPVVATGVTSKVTVSNFLKTTALYPWAANVLSILGAADYPAIRALLTPPEIDGHTDVTLTAAQCLGNTVYNTGQAAADVAIGLPTAAANMNCGFTVGTAQSNKWGVRADTNDKIYLIADDGTISAGADHGYARMTAAQIGQYFSCFTFKTDAYDWICTAGAVGTSTFAAN